MIILIGRKTPLRSTLSDERTSDLTFIAHKKEILKGLDDEEILNEFGKANRMVALSMHL